MNGIHDLGGMHGHGRVSIEPNEPVFHHDWEARVLGMAFPVLAQCGNTSDKHRYAIERMDPAHYLASSYYEHWLCALETQLLEKGLITRAELESGRAAPGQKAMPVLTADIVDAVLATGASAKRAEGATPRFAPGDRVRTRNDHPLHHTRLPRYARGKVGTIQIDHGIFFTPDTVAHDLGEKPQPLYSVSFAARELWGPDAPAADTMRVDIWDEFLEKVRDDE
jgi:nitrile hydratase subunit beta